MIAWLIEMGRPLNIFSLKVLLFLAIIFTEHYHHRVDALPDLIDNTLIDVPEIECYADTIEMRFKTKRRFTGKIYVQGHYSNPDCRVDYSKTTADGNPVGGIRLQHGSCDMNRQRMVTGMQFSTILVISFHPVSVVYLWIFRGKKTRKTSSETFWSY